MLKVRAEETIMEAWGALTSKQHRGENKIGLSTFTGHDEITASLLSLVFAGYPFGA
jgi:hypothetical protein